MASSWAYQVEPYTGPHWEPVGWCVTGPGLGGWQGIIPRTHDAMTKEHAQQLADLLNRAYRLGQIDRSRKLMQLLGDH